MKIGDYIIDLQTYQHYKVEYVQFEGYAVKQMLAVNDLGLRKTFYVNDKDKTWTYPIV